jgi:hypothetical protein
MRASLGVLKRKWAALARLCLNFAIWSLTRYGEVSRPSVQERTEAWSQELERKSDIE